MKIRTNHSLIEIRQRIGRYAAFGGMLVLIGGFIVSFRAQETQSMILVSYAALIIGLLLSSVGIYLADKWLQEPRDDRALADAFKGFDDRYTLYNYVLPADHVLASPYGLTIFNVKRHGDTVRYADGKWKHEQSIFKKFQSLSRERLGDPIEDMEEDVERMAALLEQALPEAEVPVEGAIVFTHPDVVLETGGAPADVLHVKKLKSYIRRADRRLNRISNSVLEDVQALLDEAAVHNAPELDLEEA